MKKTWSSSLTQVEHTKQCNHNTTSLYSWSFLFQNLIYPGKKQKQGSHTMGKAVEFMSTTYKTFDEIPSALNLLRFFYWKLVQHAAQGEHKCSTLHQRNKETKTDSHLACKRVPSHSKDYLLYRGHSYIMQIFQSMGVQMISPWPISWTTKTFSQTSPRVSVHW